MTDQTPPGKRPARKPLREIGVMAFPKQGPVRPILERLPDTNEAQEDVVARKFCAALREQRRLQLEWHGRGTEPDDFECRLNGTSRVRVQMVEVVDRHAIIRGKQREGYVAKACQGTPIPHNFSGCLVEILDDQLVDRLPALGSRDGKVFLAEFSIWLAQQAADAHTLKVGWRRLRDLDSRAGKISIFVQRRREPNGMPAVVTWREQRIYREGDAERIVLGTVKGKLDKFYDPPGDEFWLLLWSTTDNLLLLNLDRCIPARELLTTRSHPFSQVWAFAPMPDGTSFPGHAAQIWPELKGY